MASEFMADSDRPPDGKPADKIRPAGQHRDRQPTGTQRTGGDDIQVLAHRTVPAMHCVLIVDDDESVRQTMADLLEIVGYIPLQASGCQEALAILRQDARINVLVTDLSMPGADGLTLIRHARDLRHDLPVILLTGYADQVDISMTAAAGNVHLMRKPVESRRLVEKLARIVMETPKLQDRM